MRGCYDYICAVRFPLIFFCMRYEQAKTRYPKQYKDLM